MALEQPAEANTLQMAKKDDLKTELTKLGIAFDDSMTNAELEALVPAGDPVLSEPEDVPAPIRIAQAQTTPGGLPSAVSKAPAAESHVSVEVGDPQLLRPVELPLVIKPANGGSWANDEQARYAATLNAAAYSNPVLWAQVKDAEVARLVEIGTNPAKFYQYTGISPQGENLSYKNKLIG